MEPIKDFEKIHLNLENCIVPKDRLVNTPSQKLGMSHELEVDLRITGCEYIQTAGLLLQLPQVAMATAQVLFQRFYYAKSFTEYKVRVSSFITQIFLPVDDFVVRLSLSLSQPMAMACLFVAAKIEEDCRKIRDVVNVFHHLSQKRTGRYVLNVLFYKYGISTQPAMILCMVQAICPPSTGCWKCLSFQF